MRSKHIPPPMPEPPMPEPEPPDSFRLYLAVVFVAALALGCSLLTPAEPQTCEADYYRGVYTLCMVLNAQTAKGGSTRLVDCAKLAEEAMEKGWHDLEAPGFEWPPEQDVSGSSVRR